MSTKYKRNGQLEVIERIYNDIPAFTDVFTEESFYVFAMCFTLTTILVVIILSRFITLKPMD